MAQLNIKAVCKLTGLNSNTLRAWERRYEAVKPVRTPSGHRLYSYADVERLQLLANLTAGGHSIANLSSLTDPELRELTEKTPETTDKETTKTLKSEVFNSLLNDLEKFDLRHLSLQLANLRNRHDVRSFVLNVVSPLLGEVGAQVLAGRISMAQEHALSAILRAQLGQIVQGMVGTPSEASARVVFSTPEGELHEFGILLAALLGGYWGLEVNFLGANLPAAPLAEATEALSAHYIVLGISPFTKELSAYLKELDAALESPCEVLVGGPKASTINFSKLKNKFRALETLQEIDSLFESLSPR